MPIRMSHRHPVNRVLTHCDTVHFRFIATVIILVYNLLSLLDGGADGDVVLLAQATRSELLVEDVHGGDDISKTCIGTREVQSGLEEYL